MRYLILSPWLRRRLGRWLDALYIVEASVVQNRFNPFVWNRFLAAGYVKSVVDSSSDAPPAPSAPPASEPMGGAGDKSHADTPSVPVDCQLATADVVPGPARSQPSSRKARR